MKSVGHRCGRMQATILSVDRGTGTSPRTGHHGDERARERRGRETQKYKSLADVDMTHQRMPIFLTLNRFQKVSLAINSRDIYLYTNNKVFIC